MQIAILNHNAKLEISNKVNKQKKPFCCIIQILTINCLWNMRGTQIKTVVFHENVNKTLTYKYLWNTKQLSEEKLKLECSKLENSKARGKTS